MEVEIESVLSDIEWRNLAECLNETQGMAWFQVLPVGQKSSQPMQFNVIHVVPKEKMPVVRLPLDLLIANKIAYTRKLE